MGERWDRFEDRTWDALWREESEVISPWAAADAFRDRDDFDVWKDAGLTNELGAFLAASGVEDPSAIEYGSVNLHDDGTWYLDVTEAGEVASVPLVDDSDELHFPDWLWDDWYWWADENDVDWEVEYDED